MVIKMNRWKLSMKCCLKLGSCGCWLMSLIQLRETDKEKDVGYDALEMLYGASNMRINECM